LNQIKEKQKEYYRNTIKPKRDAIKEQKRLDKIRFNAGTPCDPSLGAEPQKEGSGEYPLNDDYIPIGKYKAHNTKLMGGKLQIRSNNNNQVYNLKSQVISTNIRDILLKLNKGETINYKDVDNLTIDEKNQLYTIGKKLHISQLFDIPSTLKSEEEKLVSDFLKLRGSLMAGNNSKELLREFKINILKMKNNKLISLQEYNEVLNILLDMDF
jgi:hypothetical protein